MLVNKKGIHIGSTLWHSAVEIDHDKVSDARQLSIGRHYNGSVLNKWNMTGSTYHSHPCLHILHRYKQCVVFKIFFSQYKTIEPLWFCSNISPKSSPLNYGKLGIYKTIMQKSATRVRTCLPGGNSREWRQTRDEKGEGEKGEREKKQLFTLMYEKGKRRKN